VLTKNQKQVFAKAFKPIVEWGTLADKEIEE